MNNRSAQKGGIITALVYTRVSSEDQERDGLSLPSQLMDCRQYASYQGWVIGAEFTDTMSGKRDDRPSYVAMLAEARQRRVQGQAVVVVVKWLHRLGRKVLERARSWTTIGRVPWGYRLRPATADERKTGSLMSVLDIDPGQAPFVVQAFELVASGKSARSVARWAARLPDHARGGRLMVWRTFERALSRTISIARPVQGEGDVCFSSDPGKVCNQTADAGRVDRLVLDSIGAVLDGIATDPRVRAGLKRAWQGRQAAEGSDAAPRSQQLESQIKRARERIRRGTELLVDGTIERQAYDDLVAKARADMETAESELPSLRRDGAAQRLKLPPIEQVLAAAGSWTAVLEGADIVAQREVLAVLVNRIVPVRVKHGVYRVDMTWTPLGDALRATSAHD